MTAKAKLYLHGFVNLVVNTGIMGFVPSEYKPYALLVFNLAQIVLTFLDPSYAYMKLGKGK